MSPQSAHGIEDIGAHQSGFVVTRGRAGVSAWLAGILLTLAAVILVFGVPGRGDLVFYIQSSGANEVHVPVGYWLAAAAWMVIVSRAIDVPLAKLAPRAVVLAFCAHILVLLAAFAPLVGDASAFSTPAYQGYARLFCAAILVAATTASIRAVIANDVLFAPVIVATAAYASYMFGAAMQSAAIAVVAGATAAGMLRDARHGRYLRGLAQRLQSVVADDAIFMVLIFAAALAVRLFYLQRVMSNPGYLETGADGPVYDELAWSIAQGNGIRETFTNRFPLLLLGYVWFVSAIYWLAGHSYVAVGAIQAVIGSAACVLFYDVARALCGRTVAQVASWFAVISFPLLFAAAAIGHQAIDVFLTMLIVWTLVRAGDPRDWAWWRWCLVGALFGVAIAIRETVMFFLAFVLVWIPFLFPRPVSRHGLGAAGLVAVTAFISLAPLTVPKIATPEQRAKLQRHFDVLYRGEADPVRMRDEIVGPLSDPAAAVAQFRQSPAVVVGTLARAWSANFALQFFAQPYGGFDLVFLRKGTAYYYTLWFYAYGLAVAGLLVMIRRLNGDRRSAGILLIIGLIVSRTIPHIILESNYRHRVPIEPFLILLAAVAAVELFSSARLVDAHP